MSDDEASDASHESSPSEPSPERARRLHVTGWLMIILSPFLALAADFVVLDPLTLIPGFGDLLSGASGGILVAVGWLIFTPLIAGKGAARIREGPRHGVVSAEDLVARDPRPPVVYLRSFRTDEATQKVERVTPTSFSNPFVMAIQSLRQLLGRGEEEYWTHALSHVGPVIAIGAPGQLPFRGAARLYAAEHEWQSVVLNSIRGAALVVVFAGDTEGVWWEIIQVTTTIPREKLLFLLPTDAAQYGRFRDRMKKELGVEFGVRPRFPAGLQACGVLWFSPSRGTQIEEVSSASQVGVDKALRPVFAELTP